jgi:predicted nucleotidyltransferase
VTAFQAEKILAVLNNHGVRYVLIGGLAAALHGSITPTFDVDITPEMTRENLRRLSASLDELDARVRVEGVPEGLPFAHDATSLAAITTLNLVTRHGDLDIATQPAGVTRYEEWAAKATEIVVLGVTVPVADLGDIVASKEAAGREKDRAQLPALRALLDRLRQQHDD